MLHKISAILTTITLAAMTMFPVPVTANAAVGTLETSWSRETIGTGWASARYTHIFNAGDLDHNGFEDMMLTDTNGDLWFYPTVSDRTFKSRQKVGWGWRNMRNIFGGVDFNGDGDVDILGIDLSGNLYLYPGVGTGRFAAKQRLGSGWGSVNNISMTQRGFNGNPIIVGSIRDTLKAWQTDGHGRFTTQITYGSGWNAMKLTAITGDVNGDGYPDMWAVSKTGDLRLYLTKNALGNSFNIFKAGTGWSSIKYFLPTASKPRTVRAIFPDGDLRQYRLNSYTILSQQSGAALVKAKEYLSWMHFSKLGLYDQLVYEGFTANEAQYAVDRVGADWNTQAKLSAQRYLDIGAFSESELQDQLIFEKYTPEQASYGVVHSGANWNEEALQSARSYLKMNISYTRIPSQLKYEGFTTDQIEYAMSRL